MDENGHIEFHLMLDEVWEELQCPDPPATFTMELSVAELSVITAALGLLRHLADDDLISLALDEVGELGDPREKGRRQALEQVYIRYYTAYTALLLGNPHEA